MPDVRKGVKMKYKRLTKRSENGVARYNCTKQDQKNCYLWIDCGECPVSLRALRKLCELEDKIENGTLKEVPENSVVVSKEELRQTSELKAETLKLARQETAREILGELYMHFSANSLCGIPNPNQNSKSAKVIARLAKQYGVEE